MRSRHIFRGRESFWTPAHIVLYSGVGVMLLSVILLSFRLLQLPKMNAGNPAKASIFSGLGLKLVSAPIDDWWHSMFGSDVSPWTPPHLLATSGFTLLLSMAVLLFYLGSGRLVKAFLVSTVAFFATLPVPLPQSPSS